MSYESKKISSYDSNRNGPNAPNKRKLRLNDIEKPFNSLFKSPNGNGNTYYPKDVYVNSQANSSKESMPNKNTKINLTNSHPASHKNMTNQINGKHIPSQNGYMTNDKNVAKNNIEISSDSSDNENNNIDNTFIKSPTLERTEKILNNVLKSYGSYEGSLKSTSGDSKAIQLIKDSLNKTSDNSCLICIGTIKNKHAVWSCPCCYTIFHLQCIQTWIKDGAYKNAINPIISSEFAIDIKWTCPKCRSEYDKDLAPKRYLCFCGKEEDPSNEDPWLLPHSCGKICSKTLVSCSHTCLMLCHPGPCPPCPKTNRVSCHCGTAQPVVRRCAAQAWSCGKICKRKQDCAQHTCHLNCHTGPCPPCKKESIQPCDCGHSLEKRPCQSPNWKCNKVCGKEFSCGYHECESVCHEGECERYCPRSGHRTCPCGKQRYDDIPCYKETPSCRQTCEKLMPCGVHKCQERCHVGPCGMCRQPIERTCRCGQSKKMMPCNKEFVCEIRCGKMRNCGVHVCRRKCCDGECNDCDLVCGAPLNCRKHKCTSPCHRGLCYPCAMTIKIPCSCGKTIKSVPCGKEKKTKPPLCKELCRKPPGCHHTKAEAHYCHFGDCPPCRFPCTKMLECGHACGETCHSFALVPKDSLSQISFAGEVLDNKPTKRNAPWEPKPSNELAHTNLSCPPCKTRILVKCLGGHGTKEFECHEACAYSCGDFCGKKMDCGNHSCTRTCHPLKISSKDIAAASRQRISAEAEECDTCQEACSKPRPVNCPHDCQLPCHPGPCPACNKMIKMKCLCGLNPVYVECSKWRRCLLANDDKGATAVDREKLSSCGNRCPNLLPNCGHRCPDVCHQSPCGTGPEAKKCVAKVKVCCKCRTIRKVMPCHQASTITATDSGLTLPTADSLAILECLPSCSDANECGLNEDDSVPGSGDYSNESPNLGLDPKVSGPAKSMRNVGGSVKMIYASLTLCVLMISIMVAYYKYTG